MFTDAAIKETLRVTPIGQRIFSRELEEPIVLKDGRVLPKGVPIHINILDLHRREELWVEADSYRLERFLPREVHKSRYWGFWAVGEILYDRWYLFSIILKKWLTMLLNH